MADTKYLQRRGKGKGWYLRVPRPPEFWRIRGEFVVSLHTSDLKVAQHLRDKYLVPLLAESASVEALRLLEWSIRAGQDSITRNVRELRAALAGSGDALALAQAGQRFIKYLEASRAYAPASIRKYAAALDAAYYVLGPDKGAETLGKADAAEVRDRLLSMPVSWQRRNDMPDQAAAQKRHLSARTVGQTLMYLRRFFRWLIAEGQVQRQDNPFDGITVARVVSKQKRAPTVAEADALMRLPKPQSIDRLTWEAMPLIARYTGCRAGEVAQFRLGDVVERQGIRCLQVTAHGAGRRLKTAGSERLVPVADKLATTLAALLQKRKRGRLLRPQDYTADDGTTKYAHGFLKHWNRRAKAVAPDLSFHSLRVYANDQMATAGVDIIDRERILGHRSERTQAAYTPENLERLKRAVDSIH